MAIRSGLALGPRRPLCRAWLVFVLSSVAGLALSGAPPQQTANGAARDDAVSAAVERAREWSHPVSLPRGHREIRLRGGRSPLGSSPVPMLRLVEHPSGTRVGELVLFRFVSSTIANVSAQDERCVPFRADESLCARLVVVPPMEWPGIAAKLEALGAWSIVEACEIMLVVNGKSVPINVSHGGELVIHRYEGGAFTTYRCGAPADATNAGGKLATAIHEYLGSLARPGRP